MIHLSIVIPAYNESRRLSRTFSCLNLWKLPKDLTIDEIIFVNDGSSDNTLSKLKHAKLKFPKRIVSYTENMGKGYAVKSGMLHSKSPYTLLMDADIATPLDQIEKFIPFMKSGTDCIIGTRKNGHSTVVKHQPFIRENMGKFFTFLSRTFLNVKVTDFTCGFKAFSKKAKDDIFPRSQINRWGYDSEIIFLSYKLGYSIKERSVVWSDQKNTKVNLLHDALDSFLELLKIRLNDHLRAYESPRFNYNS